MTDLIVVASNDMKVWCDAAKVVKCFLVADIARADNLLYFPRNKEFLELGREVGSTMRDVEVSYDKHQHHLVLSVKFKLLVDVLRKSCRSSPI